MHKARGVSTGAPHDVHSHQPELGPVLTEGESSPFTNIFAKYAWYGHSNQHANYTPDGFERTPLIGQASRFLAPGGALSASC